jgi:hypothetical protein
MDQRVGFDFGFGVKLAGTWDLQARTAVLGCANRLQWLTKVAESHEE